MAERRITAFFDTYDEAAKAIRRLEAAGMRRYEISLVANNFDGAYSRHASHTLEHHTHADEGAGAGATVGTLAGGGAGLLAGLGMLSLPGFGPVVAAGWLVSTLVGAGAGAAVGGLFGALIGAGFTEEEAETYAEGVRRGGALVTVNVDEADVVRVVDILDDEGRVDMGESDRNPHTEITAPPIGAAASTTTGLTTDLMPNPLDDEEDRLEVEVEDERLRRMTGTDREGA